MESHAGPATVTTACLLESEYRFRTRVKNVDWMDGPKPERERGDVVQVDDFRAEVEWSIDPVLRSYGIGDWNIEIHAVDIRYSGISYFTSGKDTDTEYPVEGTVVYPPAPFDTDIEDPKTFLMKTWGSEDFSVSVDFAGCTMEHGLAPTELEVDYRSRVITVKFA